jgi:hypothetical protein
MSKLIVVSFLVTVLSAFFSWAGPSSSGGGPGIVCLSADNQVLSSQSYDLYEGTILFGLKISRSQKPLDDQINLVISRLKAYNYFIGADFEESIKEIRGNARFLPDGVLMGTGVNDLGPSFPPVVPAGCDLEYIGFYQNNDTLKISKSAFDKMSPTDQAALFTHEAFYRMARTFSRQTNSENARRFTSILFSTSDLHELDSIAANLTWNNSRFYLNQHLQFPLRLEGNDDKLIAIFSNPLKRNMGFELECKDQYLQSVSLPSAIRNVGTDTIVDLPFTKRCKLLKVVRRLQGGMHEDWGKLTDIKITLVYSNKTAIEIQSTPYAEGDGNVYEEMNFPLYK